jgi:Cytochrome P450
VNPWVQLYHGLKGDRHLWLHSLHQKHGSHVRVAPNFVSVNTAQGLHDIYGFGKPFKKSDFYNAFPAIKGVYNTHNVINKTVHGRKRRVLSHAFSDHALKSMEGVMLLHIRRFCDVLAGDIYGKERISPGGTKGSVVWNLAEWFGYLTYDVMGELCFGKSFDMLINNSRRQMTHLVDRAAYRHYVVCLSPLTLTIVFPSSFYPLEMKNLFN